MANRFWVGGAGNWSSTTKWSDTSGGASGFSVPTSADDAIFDANSGGKFTATVDTAQSVNSLTITPSSGAGILTISLTADLTTGNLTTTGTAGNNRIFFTSTTYGIAKNFTVNGTVSIFDCDFRGVYVLGTAAPISGTRIGNCGECRGITFSTPKTVYWNLAGAQNWSADGWTDTSTGTPNTNFFPLPQDTATFTDAGSVTGTITLNAAIAYCPNVAMSGRTSAMTLGTSSATTVYGNWTNGSGTAFTGTSTLTFAGGTTQTITSAGKTFSGPITVDTYGGTVQLADALNLGVSNGIAVTNGAFNTQGFAVTAGSISSNNSNIRSISLGASTLTLGATVGLNFSTSTNLTLNAGTSQINLTNSAVTAISTGFSSPIGLTFYNVSFLAANLGVFHAISGVNTFNNLSFTSTTSAGLMGCNFDANQTINGTLTCSGATAVRRIFLRSSTINTPRTLTVNSISATDCDFRDITLAGAASGASPTRAGNCGGNTGIIFPAAKTVYWNLAGAQDWSATAWASSSGGTPDINNFPLAQDTAVFDNTGSVTGTITINTTWNIGTFDASLRTSAMTLTTAFNPAIYGDWKFGTGVTSTSTGSIITFLKPGTQTITSNGVQFGCPVTISHPLANVQLADALSLGPTRALRLTTGTLDAVSYNVTTGMFTNSSNVNTLRMGSGTWTITGVGSVWNFAPAPITIAGTATIVLSDTSTSARTFSGGGVYCNKLTIGGTTGTSTLTINNSNTFGEIASTKTVAHTITFPANTLTTVGKWAVTGTVGNVVTVNSSTAATAFVLFIAGPANSGINYLSVRDCTVSTTSSGEFYVGANSTNVSGNSGSIIFTATPAPRTLYWRGATGDWSASVNWSLTSGGSGGNPIPKSLDSVIFNSASGAGNYTVSISAGGSFTFARCASFTMGAPLTGTVTLAGVVGIAFHGDVSFAATGVARTYTGLINMAGDSSSTFTTNGLAFASFTQVVGIGSTWTLGSALNIGVSSFETVHGSFSTSGSNYSVTCGAFASNRDTVRSVSLNNSTITCSGNYTFTTTTNLTFNAGGSTLITSAAAPTVSGGSLTFYNVSFTSAAATAITITGANTFNNLTFTGRTTLGITPVTFDSNQTINGTLTVTAGTASAYRTFLASSTIGTPRTLTCAAETLTDVDFRDIVATGAGAPFTGTRLGDAKGNSGITFPAVKTVYWAQATSGNWGAGGAGTWSATSGGSAANTEFPLAQDTAYIPFAVPNNNQTITVNANYNIGTLDMNERNGSALLTLAASTSPFIHGNWINGTGTTLTGTGAMTFAGRTTQQITSAGKSFSQLFFFNTPGGLVVLQDAFTVTNAGGSIPLIAGTFNANNYNVVLAAQFSISGSSAKTLNFGSGTWTFSATSNAFSASSSNFTILGTATLTFTSAASKNFVGGDASYSGITLNQGGAGALTISGNNTFKTITNTYSATGATSILLGNTTQTLTNPWTATGAASRVLTVSGTSAASPATLIFSGSGTAANVNYLAINNVRAYDLVDEWYAGPNSTNGGSLGWYFVATGGTVYAVFIEESASGVDAVLSILTAQSSVSEAASGVDEVSATATAVYDSSIAEAASGVDAVESLGVLGGTVIESASGVDVVSALAALSSAVAESASGVDVTSALASLGSAISEAASGVDAQSSTVTLLSSIAEAASAIDAVAGGAVFTPIISETASGVDAVASSAVFTPVVSELASGIDEVSALASLGSAVSETANGLDAAAATPVYAQSINEAASGVDATASTAVFTPVISESVSGVDDVYGFSGVDRSVSETATAVDSVSTLAVLGSTITEAASGVDATSALASLGSAVSEAASGLDTPSAGKAVPGDVSETATGADSNLAAAVFTSSASEAASGIDTVSILTVRLGAVTEAASGVDSTVATAVFTSSALEAASGLDTVSSRADFGGRITEAASGIDSTVGFISFPSSVAEAASGVDTTSGSQTMAANAAETASGLDSTSTLVSFGGVVSESSSGVDTVSALASLGSAISEAASGIDTAAPAVVQSGDIVEAASGADSQLAFAVFTAANTEAASGVDAAAASFVFLGTVNEASSGLDAVASAPIIGVSVVETTSGAEEVAAKTIFGSSTVETADGADAVSASSVFLSSANETASGVDEVLGSAVFPNVISEAASGIDFTVGIRLFAGSVSETASGVDAVAAQAALVGNISETASGEDQVSTAQTFAAALAEFVSALDDFSPAGSVYNVSIAESMAALDLFSAMFLWNLIDDAQTPDWGSVNNAQTVTWAAVDDNQSANWQNANNAQTPGWTDVNDDQTPGWTPITT